MKIKRSCKTCNKKFSAIKTTQLFCRRACFKKDYYERTKARLQKEALSPVYPKKKCGFCNTVSQLTYNPIKYPHLFDSWECPVCGVNAPILWKYQEQPNSHQIIEDLLVVAKQIGSTPIPQVDALLAQNSYHPIGQQKATMVIVSCIETVVTKKQGK